MSHVDDGTIQAYLDQQLEFAEPQARRAFERHLADHPDDAARVEAARAIRERAIGLLGPREADIDDLPPFAAVVERARATSSRRAHLTKLRSIRTLGLAASVAMVFAVGWWLRPNLMTDNAAPASALNESLPADAPDAEPPAEPGQLADQDRQAAAEAFDDRAVGFAEADRNADNQAANRAAAPPVSAASRKATEEAQALRQQEAEVVAVTGGRGVAAPPPAAQRARRAAGDAVALDEVAGERREVQAAPDSLVAAQVSRDLLSESPRANATFAQVAQGFADWNNSDMAEAERLLGSPVLAVEGWTVERVAILDVSGAIAVGVVQRLGTGVQLGLIQMAAPETAVTAAERADASQATLAQVFEAYPNVIRGRLWIAGVADLPRDSVVSLLRTLREAPRPN